MSGPSATPPPPPPGFKLDDLPPPPAGFTVDGGAAAAPAAAPAEKSIWQQLREWRPDFSVSRDDVERTLGDVGRGAGMLGRGAIGGVTALPGIAADAVMSGYNALTGDHQQMPSAATQQVMDQAIPPPQNTGESLLQTAAGAATGLKVPLPLPAGAPGMDATHQSLAQARASGYVTPQSEVNPTLLDKLVETVLGKKELAAEATKQNLTTLSKNIAQDLGVPPNTEISQNVLDAVRANAGKAYDRVAQLGPQYDQLVQYIKEQRNVASRLFRQNATNYNVATEDAANAAWKNAESAESALGQNLASTGQKGLMDDYLAARKMIAKTYDVEKSLIESRGQLNPAAFEKGFANGKPQSGEILTAGRATEAFPKAFKTNPSSGQVLGPVDTTILGSGAGVGLFMHDPKYAGYALAAALARAGGRKLALSGPVQDMMLASPEQKKMALANAILRGTSAAYGADNSQ